MQKRNKQSRHGCANSSANTGAIGQTANWTINEYIPVDFSNPINFPTLADPFILQYTGGVNGFSVELSQGGTPIQDASSAYGSTTDQFEQLSLVWQTYRIAGVTVEWRPTSLAGIGSQSPMLSVVEAAGQTVPFAGSGLAQNVLLDYSRSRAAQLHPWTGASRKVDFSQWLNQTVAQPWLLTRDSNGTRVPYSETDPTTPVIKFAAQIYTGITLNLGFFIVKTHYLFRGRQLRVDTLPSTKEKHLVEATISAGQQIQELPGADLQPQGSLTDLQVRALHFLEQAVSKA